MNRTDLVRYTLWASAPFNFAAGYILAFPSSAAGQFAGLPASVPPLYTALLSFLVCLFGGAYAWLAAQATIDRPLVAVAAIGKTGVFVVALSLWLSGGLAGRVVLIASGDLAFASLWIWWLLSTGAETDIASS